MKIPKSYPVNNNCVVSVNSNSYTTEIAIITAYVPLNMQNKSNIFIIAIYTSYNIKDNK